MKLQKQMQMKGRVVKEAPARFNELSDEALERVAGAGCVMDMVSGGRVVKYWHSSYPPEH